MPRGPLIDLALGWSGEVVGHSGKGLDVSLGPFVGRFHYERPPFTMNHNSIGFEPELLRQANRLAPSRPKHLCPRGFHHISRYTAMVHIAGCQSGDGPS